MQLNPVYVYQEYILLKLHFKQSSYDYFKFNGKGKNLKCSSFDKRKDKNFFIQLSRKMKNAEELKNFLVSNFIADNEFWIGDIHEEISNERFICWKKRTESLFYNFKNEMIDLSNDFGDKVNFKNEMIDLSNDFGDKGFNHLFNVEEGQHPVLLREYLAEKISLETMVLLNRILNFLKVWDVKINDPFIWEKTKIKILKYDSFIENVDLMKYKNEIKKCFSFA